jgi:exosortase/archaeosortase family protein
MRALLIAIMICLFAMPASAETWTVEYSRVGDVSFITPVFPPGTYELVKTPDFIPVYLREATIWNFIGMYGGPAAGHPQAALPESFPTVAFTGLYDVAIVRPLGGGGGNVVATPELAILRSFTKHIGGKQLHAALNPPLQRLTAWSAATLLGASSWGDRIYLPQLTLEVQEWCSGLVQIKWLLVLAVVCLAIGRVPWPWALGVIVAVPLIGFEVNVLRVVGIGLAYERYGWAVKDWMGWGATIFGVAQVIGLGTMARRIGR